jgi:hypothetical protein
VNAVKLAASTVEHDYNGYLKIALAVLLTAAEQGAAPPHTLAPFIAAMNASIQDAHPMTLFAKMNALLRNPRLGDDSPHSAVAPRKPRRSTLKGCENPRSVRDESSFL